jgi:hypothetical protein
MLARKTGISLWSGAPFDGDGDGDGYDGRDGSGGEDVFDGFGDGAFGGLGDGNGESPELVLED